MVSEFEERVDEATANRRQHRDSDDGHGACSAVQRASGAGRMLDVREELQRLRVGVVRLCECEMDWGDEQRSAAQRR